MPQRFGPAVASWGPGRLDVFGVGTGRAMFHRAFDTQSGQWMDDWESLGGGFSSLPAVVSWGPGRLDVFGLGIDRAVYHQAYDTHGAAWLAEWDPLGGRFQAPYPPAVASWGPGRLDVFGVGDDRALYHQAFDTRSGDWMAAWERLDAGAPRPPRGVVEGLAGPAAVVSRQPERLDVFCMGRGGTVEHRAYSPTGGPPEAPSWQPWEDIAPGRGFYGIPAVVSWAPDRIDIVSRAVGSGALFSRFWNEGGLAPGWSPWRGLGFTASSQAAVSWGFERLDVVAVSAGFANHAPWNATLMPGSTPGPFTLIPGDGHIASAPAAVSWGPGRIDIFAVSEFGDMRHQAFEPATGWMRGALGPLPWVELGWESLGGVFYEPPEEWSL